MPFIESLFKPSASGKNNRIPMCRRRWKMCFCYSCKPTFLSLTKKKGLWITLQQKKLTVGWGWSLFLTCFPLLNFFLLVKFVLHKILFLFCKFNQFKWSFLSSFSLSECTKKVLFKCPKENLENDTAGAEIIQEDNVESVFFFQ